MAPGGRMLTIIGCGNANRSDDAAGVVVVERLIARRGAAPAKGIRIYDAGTDGMGVMFRARGSHSLIIIDACDSGAEPGAVFEVPGAELEGKPPASFNLHDFRWDHALYAGRRIFAETFPKDVTVFLIERQSLALGLELSPAVENAVAIVVERIEARLRRHLQVANAPAG